MTSTSRSLQLSWDTAWATAPPSSCQTLLNFKNVIAYGSTCIIPEDDDDPVPNQVNTACMPWLTANPSPSPSAFYSPVTACPDSWTAVATQTSGSGGDWIDGETALHCCPDGFIEGDGGNGCKPGNSGSWPVVECDEEDEQDNVFTTYSGSNWPSSVRSSIPALHVRYQATDVASGTSSPSSTSSSSSGGGSNAEDDGLSTGAIAAIATIIPVVLILAAIAGFFLWRRKKNRSAAATNTNNIANEKAAPESHSSASGSAATAAGAGGLAGAAATRSSPHATNPHETPEWNVEMDATETQLQQNQQDRPNSTYKAPLYAQQNEPAELAGLARVARKPVAPVELDSTPILPEVGDAYIPYRPGR